MSAIALTFDSGRVKLSANEVNVGVDNAKSEIEVEKRRMQREDKARNGYWSAKRNTNRNDQETINLGLFSNFQMKRGLAEQFLDSN